MESVELRVAEPTRMRRYSICWILLPPSGTRGSPYSEGGALYGMGQGLEFQHLDVYFRHEKRVEIPFRGLIHANHYDQDTKVWEHFLSGVGNKSPPNNPKNR